MNSPDDVEPLDFNVKWDLVILTDSGFLCFLCSCSMIPLVRSA